MPDDRRAAPRYRTDGPISGRYPATPFSADLVNVSQTGCKLRLGHSRVPVGSTVVLRLTETLSVSGQVVWDEKSEIGVHFHRPISAADVAEVTGHDLLRTEGEWSPA